MQIFGLKSLFPGLKVSSAIDQKVRKTLVASLYTNPFSLIVGAVTGILVCLSAALATEDPAIIATGLALAGIAAARIMIALAFRYIKQANTRTLELLFEFGAFAYAGAVSIMASLAIWQNVMWEAQTLLAVFAVAYASSIAARNAGRPFIAIGQLLVVLSPVTAALLSSGSPQLQILGLAMLLHIPSTISIAKNVYRSLHNSISAAETSARLAEKMQHLARTDVVTGLHNRAGLNHYIVEHLSRRERSTKLALFWLDLDKFKEVNDALGHHTGDLVLCEVAQRLRSQARPGSVIGRLAATSSYSPATSRTAARSRPSHWRCLAK